MAESPTSSTGMTQERNGIPFRCTVQAPQRALPQPNFVPVMPSTSRSTHNNGMSPSTSTSCSAPLTLIFKAIGVPFWDTGVLPCRTAIMATLWGYGKLLMSTAILAPACRSRLSLGAAPLAREHEQPPRTYEGDHAEIEARKCSENVGLIDAFHRDVHGHREGRCRIDAIAQCNWNEEHPCSR